MYQQSLHEKTHSHFCRVLRLFRRSPKIFSYLSTHSHCAEVDCRNEFLNEEFLLQVLHLQNIDLIISTAKRHSRLPVVWARRHAHGVCTLHCWSMLHSLIHALWRHSSIRNWLYPNNCKTVGLFGNFEALRALTSHVAALMLFHRFMSQEIMEGSYTNFVTSVNFINAMESGHL